MEAIKSELLELFRRQDLMRAALLLGKIENSNFDPNPYGNLCMELSSQAWEYCSGHRNDPIMKAEAIQKVLFKDFGLIGKSDRHKQIIDDPDRYYIHSVLTAKTGNALSITALFSILTDQIGLDHQILLFPSHYLLKVADVTGEFFIEPFDSGRLMTTEEYQKKYKAALQRNRMLSPNLYEQLSPVYLVARLAQQLKHVYILKGKALEAVRAVELLTALFPTSAELTRDRGVLYCEMEYFSKAVADLNHYLIQRPEAEDVREIKKLTHMLKGYSEVMN